MSCFKRQPAYCMICGTSFLSDYSRMKNGSICDLECLKEWQWRDTLFILGKDYYIDPTSRLGILAAKMDVEEEAERKVKKKEEADV